MKVKVFLLRRSGRRFHDRGQEGVDGELRMHAMTRGAETHKVAQLCRRVQGSSKDEEVIPPLYCPELVAVVNGAMLLRGYESAGNVGYVQEWRCVIAV